MEAEEEGEEWREELAVCVDARVRLHSLERRSDLNHRTGVVARRADDGCRWVVNLRERGAGGGSVKQYSFRVENLRVDRALTRFRRCLLKAEAGQGDWTSRSLILDGELLVFDEGHTQPGLYDELGSSPGIVGSADMDE